ncbi:MAG: CapA family protein [Clostridiales bacterium]|nr:CapA family protein [Clostridiales bacterium]
MRKFITVIFVCVVVLGIAYMGLIAYSAFLNDYSVAVFSGEEETAEAVSAEETTAETTTETTTEAAEIDLIMIGDILAHEGVYGSGRQEDGSYCFDHLFAQIKDDVQASDIALVNQEVILGGTEMGLSAYPLFNSPTELGDALVNAGFNIVLHATNHALDKGAAGIDNTIEFWRGKHPGTACLGIHDTLEDYENRSVYYYEKQGLRVAVMNYTYGTNGLPLPEGREYIINLLDEEKIKADMAEAEENADFLIVCPHWGTEYMTEPDESEKRWAQFFADNGADLVIGTHPHVIQPVETITGVNGNSTLVFYSLGNFVSNQDKIITMLGAMAKVTISNEGGSAHIKDYEAVPLVTHMLFGRNLITTYKLSDYTAELAAANRIHSYQSGLTVEWLKEKSREILGEAYRE